MGERREREGRSGTLAPSCRCPQRSASTGSSCQRSTTSSKCRRSSGDAAVHLAMLAGATTAPGSNPTFGQQRHVWLPSSPWATGCRFYAQLCALHLLPQFGRPSAFSWGGLVKPDRWVESWVEPLGLPASCKAAVMPMMSIGCDDVADGSSAPQLKCCIAASLVCGQGGVDKRTIEKYEK